MWRVRLLVTVQVFRVPALVPHEELERASGQLYASQAVINEFVDHPRAASSTPH